MDEIFKRTQDNLESSRRKKPRILNPRYNLVGFDNGYPVFKAFPGETIGNGAAEIITNGSIEAGPIKTLPGGVISAIGMPRPKPRIAPTPLPPVLEFGKVQILFVQEMPTEYRLYITGYKKQKVADLLGVYPKPQYNFVISGSTNRFARQTIQNRGADNFIASFMASDLDIQVVRFTQAKVEEIITAPDGDLDFTFTYGGGYVGSIQNSSSLPRYITAQSYGGGFILGSSSPPNFDDFWSPRIPPYSSTVDVDRVVLRVIGEDGAIALIAQADGGSPSGTYLSALWESNAVVTVVEQELIAASQSILFQTHAIGNYANIVGSTVYAIPPANVRSLAFSSTSIDVNKVDLPALTNSTFSEPIYLPPSFNPTDVTFLYASYHPGTP